MYVEKWQIKAINIFLHQSRQYFLKFSFIPMNELNRIKVVLVEQKKTGKWLSEQLGVSVTTTSRWCSNSVQPDLQTLNRIAQLLKVSIHELIKQQ